MVLHLLSTKDRVIAALGFAILLHALVIVIPVWHSQVIARMHNDQRFAPFTVRLAQWTVAAKPEHVAVVPMSMVHRVHASAVLQRPASDVATAAVGALRPAMLMLQPPVFLDPVLLGNKPVPRSEPDFSDVLAAVGNTPVLPMTLRVFILDTGRVYRVQIVKAAVEDRWVAERLAAALAHSLFVAGQYHGVETAAWQDYEFSFLPQGLQNQQPIPLATVGERALENRQ